MLQVLAVRFGSREFMKNQVLNSTAIKWMLGIGVIIGPFIGMTKWNDWQLSRLQRAISALKHPANSKFVARHGEILNFGNGNHNDFWAVELRALSVAQKQAVLKAVYDGKRVPVPNDDYQQEISDGTQEVFWQLLLSPLPKNTVYKLNNGTWNLSRFAGARDLYVVQVANIGENDNLSVLLNWRGS